MLLMKLIKLKYLSDKNLSPFFLRTLATHKIRTSVMPPKTRVSSRIANKKRKAEEVDDLSEEDRPIKKQKIENSRGKKAPPKKKTNKVTKNKYEVQESSSSEEMSESSSQEEIKVKKPAVRRRVRADARISAKKNPTAIVTPMRTTNTNVKPSEEDNPNPAELKAAALKKLSTAKEATKYHHRLEDEEYTLPDELILQIFSNLRRRDLYGVGLTCRQWLRLSNDQSLGWHSAYSALLVENFGAIVELDGESHERCNLTKI